MNASVAIPHRSISLELVVIATVDEAVQLVSDRGVPSNCAMIAVVKEAIGAEGGGLIPKDLVVDNLLRSPELPNPATT